MIVSLETKNLLFEYLPNFQEIKSTICVIFHVKYCKVEHNLTSSLSWDDPGTFFAVIVVARPAWRMEHSTWSEKIASTCWNKLLGKCCFTIVLKFFHFFSSATGILQLMQMTQELVWKEILQQKSSQMKDFSGVFNLLGKF